MKKKVFFSFIIIIMFLMVQPVLAAETYGTVRDITEETGDSLSSGKGTLETIGNTTTIRYSTASFKMLEADANAAGGARPGPAAWIGFEVSEPTDNSDSKFKVTTPDNKTTEIKASSFKDYVGITPDNLKKALLNGTMLTYKYAFDWNEDNSDDQYVIIEIDPEEITLIPTNGEDNVWSPQIAKEILAEQNPDTSDINIAMLVGLIIISGLGIYCRMKKA